MVESFADVLAEYMKREERKTGQLAKLTGIPRQTIISWSSRRVLKPQKWIDLLQIARKLNLEKAETNRLLVSAEHQTIEALTRQARKANDQKALDQLQHWQDPIPFQAPANLTSVVAREAEIEQIKTLLFKHPRICILYGIGGVGKTTLATYLAYSLRDQFPDGVLWARVDRSDLMAIYSAFGEAYNRDVTQYDDANSRGSVVRNLLANKKVLIVLDNAEQTQDVRPLLPPTTDSCAVLITTRNKRVLAGEAHAHHLLPFAKTAGLTLLSNIVGAAKINANLPVARQIIELVGGLPLAIRVVGSTLNEGAVTFQEYVELLQDERTSLDELQDDSDTTKNVRASFELSYRQLTTPLQLLFNRLAVFEGPDFSVAAATAVSPQSPVRVKIGLGKLQALSLLEISREEAHDDATSPTQTSIRYRLHPLLQTFVREKARSQLPVLQKQAIKYYVELIQPQGNRHEDYDRIDLEYDNVLNALKWAASQQEWQSFIQGVLALTQMGLGVIGYLDARGYWDQARHLLKQALTGVEQLNDPPQKARLLRNSGAFAVRRADEELATTHLQASLDILNRLPKTDMGQLDKASVYVFLTRMSLRRDPAQAVDYCMQGIAELAGVETEVADHERGNLYILLATIYGRTGRMEEAISAAETGLALLPEETTPAHVTGFNALSNIYAMQGDGETSKSYLDGAIKKAQDLGDVRILAILWMNRGIGRERRGNLRGALADHNRARQLYEQMGEVDEAGSACVNMALVQIKLGEWTQAKEGIDTAVSLATQHNLPDLTAFALVALGNWHVERGQFWEAGAALATAYAHCRQVNMRFILPVLLYWQAQVMVDKGRFTTAARLLWHGLDIAYADDQWLEAGMCWRQVGVLLDTTQQYTAAHQAYENGRQLLQNEDPYERGRLLRSLATHFLNRPNPNKQQARISLKQAFTLFKQLEAESEIARTEQLLTLAHNKMRG